MTCILPVVQPIITSFPGAANLFVILSNDFEAATPWICDNFINLIAVEGLDEDKPNDYFGNFYDEAQKTCPFIKMQVIQM